MTGSARRIDIIIPVRSEENEIAAFLERLKGLDMPPGADIGIIFVEDGSVDGTVDLLRRVSAAGGGVGFYSFKKGYGQGAAVAYGLRASTADAMITMDVDGEHPVELLPRMAAAFMEGKDIVQCTRKKRTVNKLYRRIGSFVFNKVTSLLTGVDLEEQNVYYRLISRKVRDIVVRQTRWPYFMRLGGRLLRAFPPLNIPFEVVINEGRVSKYGFWRLARFSVDGVLSLISVPRFIILEFLVAAAAALLWMAGLRVLSAVPAALAVFLIYKFIRLSSVSLPDMLEIADSGGTAAGADSH